MRVTRMLCASVLFFEAIVVALAIPVALTFSEAPSALVAAAFGGLAIACLVGAGLVGRRGGITFGWVLQGLVLLTCLVVPAMLLLGLAFGGLWFLALRYGRRADALAQHDPGPST